MTGVAGMTGMSASAARCAGPSCAASPVVPPDLLSACQDLAARYQGVFSAETVLRTVYESYQLLIATSDRTGAAVAHATRFAADWLADAACGAVMGTTRPPRVLFVCLHDSGRAQMAEALLRRRAGGRVAVRSAGPVAGRAVQPAVVAAMAELGIGICAEYPEPLLDDIVRAADVVVTMGCGDICPVYIGKRYLDWPLHGSPGGGIAVVRTVRDQIDVHVERLLDELTRRPPSQGDAERRHCAGGLRGQYNMTN
jgi:arsenate reductase (thioredoxin)